MYEKLLAFQDSKLWKGVYGVVGTLTSLCSAFLTLFIFITVIARYVFKTDIFGSEEIILLFAWWMYFMGGIGGSMEDSQIKADMVDVFVANKAVVDVFKGIAGFLEFVVFSISGVLATNLVLTNIEKMPVTTGLRIPMYVMQLALAIGFFGMALCGIYYGMFFFARSKYRRNGGVIATDEAVEEVAE